MQRASISSESTSKLYRYEKVFAVLVKYGFEDMLSHPPFNKLVPQTNFLVPVRRGTKVSQFSTYERIRMLCEELGTTFIKFAQIASNRSDLLPAELIAELEKLQDKVPEVKIEDIRSTLVSELSRPLNELVTNFEEKPLASASIAQVHRARLLGGQEVVLKIQRPNIRKVIDADIEILRSLVSVIEKYFPHYSVYQPRELLKMFERSISEELSFTIEAQNLRQFKRMFRRNPEVYVPEIYAELCTDLVLCLEYVEGYKITDLENLKKIGVTGADLAKRGIGLYYEQVFDHNFFHADPHPGNIIVKENGQISFIDYGMMGSVTESDKIQFANLLLAMYEKDVIGLKKSILAFTNDLDDDTLRELEYDIIYFLQNYTDISIQEIDGKEIMKGLNAMFYEYKIKIPSQLLLLLKALIIIEGVGLKLDPEYDIIKNIGPYVKKLLAQKFSPLKLRRQAINNTIALGSLMRDLPEDLRAILRKIKSGKIHVEIEHKGLEPLIHNTEKVVNRLSFTLLIVALILGSSILVLADIPPKVNDISILGFIGFVISGLLSLRLAYSIIKHGNF